MRDLREGIVTRRDSNHIAEKITLRSSAYLGVLCGENSLTQRYAEDRRENCATQCYCPTIVTVVSLIPPTKVALPSFSDNTILRDLFQRLTGIENVLDDSPGAKRSVPVAGQEVSSGPELISHL